MVYSQFHPVSFNIQDFLALHNVCGSQGNMSIEAPKAIDQKIHIKWYHVPSASEVIPSVIDIISWYQFIRETTLQTPIPTRKNI